MIRTLRKRFIRIAMLAVTAVMLLLCIIVNTANFVSVNSELNRMLEVIYNNQGKIPSLPFPGGRPGSFRDGQFTEETPFSTRYFVLRYTTNGVLTQADLDKIATVTKNDIEKYLLIALKHGEGFGYSSGYKYYVVRHNNNRCMAVFLSCYKETRSLATTAVLSVTAMLFCIVLVYIIVVLFSRRAIDPVVKSAERQKQFITDASHELKTPITVIATSLSVLEMETGKQKWIDKAKAQTEKLKELVNSLVTLSRMDEEQSPLKPADFDVSASVNEAAESFRDFSLSNGHELFTAIEPGITYHGDEYAVRQLVSILIDNAVKYAAEGSKISFSLSKAKKGIIIRCSNECSSPPESRELEKLFDRFYRPDKSRTSSTGGFGIGLSVAKEIAEGHKGSIHAKMIGEKTIEFYAELK